MALAPILFDPANWYWIVGGNQAQVYSSKAAAYVPTTDSTYVAWLADPTHTPTKIETEQELVDYLAGRAIDSLPPGATSTDASKDSRIRDQMSEIVGQMLLDHENRTRVLESRPTVTRQQFTQYVKTKMK